jgi:membrane protein YdbS with pleckstrin-like domain
MTRAADHAAAWIYRGLWAVLVRWFRVPHGPPALPTAGAPAETLRPAPGFLRYLKFLFWLVLLPVDLVILGLWLAIAIPFPIAGALLALPALALAVLPDIAAYVAIHLRYDSTWYALTDRSMRLRRGIWVIHETTITYENIQNVTVRQGPVQRYFGIADVAVQTAGGGGGGHDKGGSLSHLGLLEGLADAERIRDLILARVRRSRTAGLGDEHAHPISDRHHPAWTPAHLAVLREIRDRARALAG